MLNNYLQLTRLLLADAGFVQFNDFDLANYVNQSRLQVAAQGHCIRNYVTLPLVAGTQTYPFSAITGLPAGVSGVYHIRQVWLRIPGTTGQTVLYSRPFEWFGLFALNTAVPTQEMPKRWAQFGQGEAGSIFVDPIPDLPYTLAADVLGVPATLADDTTAEAIPQIWTLAVPFYAAWWALLGKSPEAADKMLERFQQQMQLARSAANPDLTMESWSRSPDSVEANRLGVQTRAQ